MHFYGIWLSHEPRQLRRSKVTEALRRFETTETEIMKAKRKKP